MSSTAIRSAVATGDARGPATRTRLVNIDNGGTLTDICVIDGDEVRYTKTLTTPFDLSRCRFDALTKVPGVVYGEERLGPLLQTTDYIRYSTTQGTNALRQRQGRRPWLLVARHAPPKRLGARDDWVAVAARRAAGGGGVAGWPGGRPPRGGAPRRRRRRAGGPARA